MLVEIQDDQKVERTDCIRLLLPRKRHHWPFLPLSLPTDRTLPNEGIRSLSRMRSKPSDVETVFNPCCKMGSHDSRNPS